jgi:hypothetical protein
MNDHFPAGFIALEGEFFKAHSKEIMLLIKNIEQHDRAEHPLKRIMTIEQNGDSTLVTTTDIHLARGIGEAVRHAYHGQLELHYNTGEHLLRVHWKR